MPISDATKSSSCFSHSHSPVALGLKYSLTGTGPSCAMEHGSQWRREEVEAIAVEEENAFGCRPNDFRSFFFFLNLDSHVFFFFLILHSLSSRFSTPTTLRALASASS